MVPTDRQIRWLFKPLLFVACLLPLALLLPGLLAGDYANPVEELTHLTGDWTLRLLLITLAMTPLRRVIGQAWPIKLRRMLGLFTFFYASIHFLTWAGLDQTFNWQFIVADIAKRPYVTVGFLGWLILLPLALTSNRWSIRKLGKNWSRLHKLVYAIVPLGVLHYLWLVKADWLEPMLYGLMGAALLSVRLPKGWLKRRQAVSPRHMTQSGS